MKAAPAVRILHGDARAMLRSLPDQSVHCVITSPPYWSLRKYPAPLSVWGGSVECEHQWDESWVEAEASRAARWQHAEGGGGQNRYDGDPAAVEEARIFEEVSSAVCVKCAAWYGQLGLEPSPSLYVDHLLEIMEEVRRVLRDDGVLWLNLGDCYASQPARSGVSFRRDRERTVPTGRSLDGLKPKDLLGLPWRVAFAMQDAGWWLRSDVVWSKPNPMPESVEDRPTKSHEYLFLMAKAESYFYDVDAIREPLAESSVSRVSQKSFDTQTGGLRDYGLTGVNPNRSARKALENLRARTIESQNPRVGGRRQAPEPGEPNAFHPMGRNKRSVWEIPAQPFGYDMCTACKRVYERWEYDPLPEMKVKRGGPGPVKCSRCSDTDPHRHYKICTCGRWDSWLAHFATFPEDLVRPCILAGTSARGACPSCGAPWERVVEKGGLVEPPTRQNRSDSAKGFDPDANNYVDREGLGRARVREEKGWRPTCEHRPNGDALEEFNHERGIAPGRGQARNRWSGGDIPVQAKATVGWGKACEHVEDPVPCVVLDPFAGSGTVAEVARALGRSAVVIEASADYVEMIKKRAATHQASIEQAARADRA